jgi:D-serine deaminase-like pyridoxal phosphate-dependent protein
MEVRGVMGYEGHLMIVEDRASRAEQLERCMDLLLAAHSLVGGDIVSAGGTGTYDLHTRVSEVQAGSYALMDTAYAKLELPFQQALAVLGTVISVSPQWAVADVGLKSLGMDHGNPAIERATVWFCSDEHVTFDPGSLAPLRPGDRVRVVPAHVDPTMAMHEQAYLVRHDEVLEVWPIDLRGW